MTREGAPLFVRLPKMTSWQIEALSERLGLTKTQLVIVAIDRMTRDLEQGALSPKTVQGELADVEATDATLGDE